MSEPGDLLDEARRKRLGRGDFLKLAGGALGLGALAYYAGRYSEPLSPQRDGAQPLYVDDEVGFPVFRGPYLQSQAQMAVFFLPADRAQLSALCDRYLNLPTGGALRYTPLLSSVVMIYAEMRVASQDGRDQQVGRLAETELSFWLLTAAARQVGSTYLPQHLAWFLPYLLVDESNAIATGREVYGFNKQMAVFEKAANIQQPEFAADVLGFQQFDPAAEAQPQRLLTLRPAAGSSVGAGGGGWADWEAARAALSGELLRRIAGEADDPTIEMAARLATQSAPLVFLKQFRDAADTSRACYQAVIEAPVGVEQFAGGDYLPGVSTLRVNPLVSHPLARRLGLRLVDGEQQTTLGAWLKLDFTLGAGVEVWRAV